MAVGGHLTLDSGSAATGGGQTGSLGDMPGGGLSLELGGQVSALPLTLTFLGTMVLAVGFLRPLRRRARPTPDLLWARFGGALAATLVLFTGSALLGHGTVRLPKGLMQGMGRERERMVRAAGPVASPETVCPRWGSGPMSSPLCSSHFCGWFSSSGSAASRPGERRFLALLPSVAFV